MAMRPVNRLRSDYELERAMRPLRGGRIAEDYFVCPGARVFAFFKGVALSCLRSPGANPDLPVSPGGGVVAVW